MNYKVDIDELEDFELTVLNHIKGSIPYVEKNGYVVFDEDTYNKFNSIEEINDGTINEIIWNEDNMNFFKTHREDFMDYLKWFIKDTGYNSVIELIYNFDYFSRDDITMDDIGNAIFNKELNPDLHSWEFQVQSYLTIFVVDNLIFKLKNIIFKNNN